MQRWRRGADMSARGGDIELSGRDEGIRSSDETSMRLLPRRWIDKPLPFTTVPAKTGRAGVQGNTVKR